MSSDDSYESVLCVKNEVLVYKIPPRPSARGYKAQDWNLDNPDWTGRLKIVATSSKVLLKLEDKETLKLYAQCPVEAFPSAAIEAVLDSSRFFVVRITDESGSRNAFVGMGFRDRADSFDMNVALQDHFKGIKREEEAKQANVAATAAATAASIPGAPAAPAGPKLDLGFREGESITIKMGAMKVRSDKQSSGGAFGSPGGGLLPPPPAPGSRVQHVRPASGVPPSGSSGSLSGQQQQPPSVQQPKQQQLPSDDLLGLDLLGGASSSSSSSSISKPAATTNSQQQPSSTTAGGGWIEF